MNDEANDEGKATTNPDNRLCTEAITRNDNDSRSFLNFPWIFQ